MDTIVELRDKSLHILELCKTLGKSPNSEVTSQFAAPELQLEIPNCSFDLLDLGISEAICTALQHQFSTLCDNLRSMYNERYQIILQEWAGTAESSQADAIVHILQKTFYHLVDDSKQQVINLAQTHIEQITALAENSPKGQDGNFTQDARDILEVFFSTNQNPSKKQKWALAGECHLDYKQITVWFCNQRTRERRRHGLLSPERPRSRRQESSDSEDSGSSYSADSPARSTSYSSDGSASPVFSDGRASPVPSFSSSSRSSSSDYSWSSLPAYTSVNDFVAVTPATPLPEDPFFPASTFLDAQLTQSSPCNSYIPALDVTFGEPNSFNFSSSDQIETTQSFDPMFWDRLVSSNLVSNAYEQETPASFFVQEPNLMDRGDEMDLASFLQHMETF